METQHEHPKDTVVQADGSTEYRDQWVVAGDTILTTSHTGSVCVHKGATFELAKGGRLAGSLTLQPGSAARIVGQHPGSLRVGRNSVVDVLGDQSGSVHVDDSGLVKVHPGGKLAGSLHVAGVIENRGIRGGSVHLNGGTIHDIEGGSVKQPIRRSDGDTYIW